MADGSSDATALLGMDGFVVLVMDQVEGEWWLLVETRAAVDGCPDCGVRAVGHGRNTVQVRDLPNGSGAVRLVWRKRRWRCPDPDCERRTFTEESELVEGSLTRRARAEICRAVGEDGHTVAELARRFGVGWATAMAAVRDHGRPRVDHGRRLNGVHTLGVDEHKMLAAGPAHHTVFATQLVDLNRGRLLDVVPGRSAKSVSAWLDERTRYWRDHVSVVAIDPHRGYHNALTSRLPRATVTIDHFHAVKLANAAIDDVRRRVQRETTGHRGRKDDPLYGARRLMTRGWERLPDHQVARLMEALRQGDIFDEIGAAIAGKELLREFYASKSLVTARRRLARFYAHATTTRVGEVSRLARTIKRWEPEILTFFETRASNAGSEAMNLITEKLRRNAHGFRNFENYRLRLLLHSGVQWNTPSTARIRGRHPRLVA
jgi:transposase